MNRILLAMVSAALLAYPLFIYFGLQYLQPRYIGVLLIILLTARIIVAKSQLSWNNVKPLLPATFAGLFCSLLMLLSNNPLMVKANPIFINAVLLMLFSISLYRPPSMIERIARLSDPDLPDEGVRYTRQVTKVWCLFFLLNGLVSGYTTFYCSLEIWTLYNGLIAYLLMAMVFAVEYSIRIRKLKQRAAM